MTNQELESLAKSMVRMTAFYGLQVQKEIILMYCEKLARFPLESVLNAMTKLTDDPKVTKYNLLPISSHVLAILEPPVSAKDEANEAASRIITAMSRFGYTNPDGAKEFVGELGWHAVGLMGGWTKLCHDTQVGDNGVLRAQLRDLCTSIHAKALAGSLNAPPRLPEPTHKTLDFSRNNLNRALGPKKD